MADSFSADRNTDRILELTGFGVPPTRAQVTTRQLTLGGRLARAGKVFGLALLAALIMLPIPLIHIAGPPLAILIGLVLGVLRLGQSEIILSAQAECPFCHTDQRLGLAGTQFKLPRDLICRNCRQPLQLDNPPKASGTRG